MNRNKLKRVFITIFTLGAIIIMAGSTTENNKFNVVKSDAVFSKKASQQYSLQKPVLKASLTKNSLKLSWSEIEEADEYRIYRSKKSNGKYKKIGTVTAGTLNFSDTDFKGERKTYYYKIKAVSYSGKNKKQIYSDIIKKTVYKRKSKVHGVTYINGILIANKTYKLPKSYNPGTNKKAYKAFKKMQSNAFQDGINLYIASGFRSYSYQKELYNRYKAIDGKKKADTYSARAGYSEHQTGLAFDINNPDSSFDNTKEAKWLAKNCAKYGFIIRYQKSKENITGYKYESWHIRYLCKGLAKKVSESGKCLEEYLDITSQYKK